MTAGYQHTCAVTTTNLSYCWGLNTSGQLGDGGTTNRLTPQAISVGVALAYVGAGYRHSCGLSTAGSAYCWGDNVYGQLGDGGTTPHLTPAPISGSLVFTHLSVGDDHNCGRTGTSQIYCWGYGGNGQLGINSTSNASFPTVISGAVSFASVAVGGAISCALNTGGAGYCWGDNSGGGIGNGTAGGSVLIPTPLAGSLTFASINPGYDFSCGRTTANAAYCWGWNNLGQLGLGNTTNTSSPTVVPGAVTWGGISASRGANTCGFNSSGVGFCWGSNFTGQIGDGTFTDRSSPTLINTSLAFAGIAMGDAHTCGFTNAGGSGYCWGNNESGQLGNGTRTVRTAPVQVLSGPATAPPIMVQLTGMEVFAPEPPPVPRHRAPGASPAAASSSMPTASRKSREGER